MLLSLLSVAFLAVPVPASIAPQEAAVATPVARARVRAAHEVKPTELFDVVRVVDGDTIHIMRNGEKQKLRLLSVDTEEKLSAKPRTTGTKPETVFGTETMHWAQDFFASMGTEEQPAQVGLAFPDGVEKNDVYGRVLCNVILPDGTDFNLKLVREGWSPYFNKYGNSLICHREMVDAQIQARTKKIGVWNPLVNVPATSDTPAAKRPYAQLLPWWEARAQAVDHYREWKERAPFAVIASDDANGLMEALARSIADPELKITIFGTTSDRNWEEENGGLTILLRPENQKETRRAVRAFMSTGTARAAINDAVNVESCYHDFMQNYLYLTGRMVDGPHGPLILADDPEQWRMAGPEPLISEPKPGANAVEAGGRR